MKLLDIQELRTNFETDDGVVQAVRGITFSIDHGESVGIVGESGCGKSVSMLSILKLLGDKAKVSAEKVFFKGVDIQNHSLDEMRKIRGKEIGMIFQDPMTSLNPVYTIGDQLCEPLMIHQNMGRKQASAKAIELLDSVGIPSPETRLKQFPHEFSGGMRQRVMIAIAMSCSPSLLIADEPTTALDVTIQAQILELMKDIQKRLGSSIIMITHDLGVIADICSRVIVMYGGIIVEEGTIDEIFYSPAHPYTQGLLKSLPKVSEKKKKLYTIPGQPPDLISPPKGCPFVLRCEKAMRICNISLPGFVDVNSLHKSRCWLLHEKASEVNNGE